MNQARYVTEQLGELASSALTVWSEKPETSYHDLLRQRPVSESATTPRA